MNEFDLPAPQVPVADTPVPAAPADPHPGVDSVLPVTPPAEAAETPAASAPVVDSVRSAAGRLGGQRVHRLAELGRQYEQEHGLSPGRQRLKQLIQLGKRYEQEHGLAVTKPRRRRRGDAWTEFLAALARVVQPKYRPAVEQLVAALRPQAPRTAA